MQPDTPEGCTKEFREQAVRLVLEEGYPSCRRASGCRCRPRPSGQLGGGSTPAVNWRPWAVSGRYDGK